MKTKNERRDRKASKDCGNDENMYIAKMGKRGNIGTRANMGTLGKIGKRGTKGNI